MKLLSLSFLFAVGAAATFSPNGNLASLDARDSFCGYDVAGNGWSCTDSGTECCRGNIISCMPIGSSCCSTGYFCKPDEECYLNTVTGVQYCRQTGSESTGTAADKETGSQTDGSSAASSTLAGSSSSSSRALVLLPIVAAAVVTFL